MFKLPKKIVGALIVVAAFPAAASSLPQTKVHNIVLVHSALVDGSSWKGVYDQLTKDGFKVSIVAHTQTSLAEDVAATKRVLDQQDGPAVLVGASYGGSIITQAGDHPNVKSLVYVAAMQPDVGESLVDLSSKIPPISTHLLPDAHGFLSLDPKVFHADFAADIPKAQADFLAAGQMPLAVAAASAKTTVAAWHDKPSYAVLATEDQLIDPKLQRYMYTRGNDKITEVKASHGVFLSQPTRVAKVIEKAAAGL
ncbi:alpha/beta hydrolase [Pseudomonas sp. TH39(2020)]|uniref:alpha/beta fold hydrolase n=1 Tax=Pseudomonas sp. TH39(2020) TaxID=2796349 RepID=UPI00191239A1|nr:alpha/beta hydrolase [Pseudomonas sp. TH39(2020)]MBK5395955.1 alpha/beta hydrolase [Pseudomonas sp. TH39(2020)]